MGEGGSPNTHVALNILSYRGKGRPAGVRYGNPNKPYYYLENRGMKYGTKHCLESLAGLTWLPCLF